MANHYSKGQVVRVSALFENAAGTDLDPTAVLMKYKDPSGNITSLVYLTDAELVKDSTGNYHVDIDADESGAWYYRFYSTGTGQTANEGSFQVDVSNF